MKQWIPFRRSDGKLIAHIQAEVVAPGLAVHPSRQMDMSIGLRWTVTHIASAGAIRFCDSEHEARYAASRLAALPADWTAELLDVRAQVQRLANEEKMTPFEYLCNIMSDSTHEPANTGAGASDDFLPEPIPCPGIALEEPTCDKE